VMLRRGLVPNIITCSAVIRACDKGALPRRALELFDAA